MGVVYYCRGEWAAAGEHLRLGCDPNAVALDKPRLRREAHEGAATFFLAMAEFQLGNTHEAQEHFDMACTWMQTNDAESEELLRHRAEAEAVLGMSGGVESRTATNPASHEELDDPSAREDARFAARSIDN